ncbi:hypothetical protein TI04_00875 [Achromatium sp. WMS2]|nr:hypothetical protein TI04_00875 [Achromatium sp. WMS2]
MFTYPSLYSCVISILISVVPCSGISEVQTTSIHGEAVSIDPNTNKPILTKTATPLWDGVHKLDNGTVITVKDGVVVPNTNLMPNDNSKPLTPTLSACTDLITKACGTKQGCANTQACSLAKQLKKLWEEAPYASFPGVANTGQTECQDGLLNPLLFPLCQQDLEIPTLCKQLVTRSCGPNNECAATTACNAALQLQQLAITDTVETLDTSVIKNHDRDCGEAFENSFFATCQPQTATSNNQ